MAGGTLLPKQPKGIIQQEHKTSISLTQFGGEKVTQKVCLPDGNFVFLIEAPNKYTISSSSVSGSEVF